MRTIKIAEEEFDIDVTYDEFAASIQHLPAFDRVQAKHLRWKALGSPNWKVDHHIWCNHFGTRPVNECRMCKGLYLEYPENNKEMIKKYFPNVKEVTNVSNHSSS